MLVVSRESLAGNVNLNVIVQIVPRHATRTRGLARVDVNATDMGPGASSVSVLTVGNHLKKIINV